MTATPEITGGGVLGEKVKGPRRQLDTFELPKTITQVTYTSEEVMSICPITGQPDWYKVEIRLYNSGLGIESKSLKLYLQSFMQEGQFCEQFAHTIATDVREVIPNAGVTVMLTQKPRGGVSIIAAAQLHSEVDF